MKIDKRNLHKESKILMGYCLHKIKTRYISTLTPTYQWELLILWKLTDKCN